MQELSSHSREIVEAGVAAGLYATPIPLQIFAYRSAQLEQVNMARTHLGAGTLLGGRILELLRIRSAQLGECEPCSQSRKHDSITDEDVACLLAPRHDALTPQEQMAVEFLDRLSGDHHSIDDEFYRRRANISLPHRSSNSASPAPERWEYTASCTPSTCTAIRSPSSTTPPTKLIPPALKDSPDRLGRKPKASQAEALHAIPDLTGIASRGGPVSFDVRPHHTVDGQRLTVGVDIAKYAQILSAH